MHIFDGFNTKNLNFNFLVVFNFSNKVRSFLFFPFNRKNNIKTKMPQKTNTQIKFYILKQAWSLKKINP